jgi:quercetin dioxygenase-like cupin family protein
MGVKEMEARMDDTRIIRFLGNNEIRVLVSAEESGDQYCVLELEVQPGGGATSLHTDAWIETFHVVEGAIEWTVERDGGLVTWEATRGETIVIPRRVKHRFAGAGERSSRMLSVGPPEFERFFRALSEAWAGPYDRERTPQAVGPVFEEFGMQMVGS